MATYLGYASYLMSSDPSTYVEPTFTPTNLPNPLPTNIDWFRALYEKAKKVGKTRVKKAIPSPVVVAPSTDDDTPLVFPPSAGEVPHESSHRSRQSTPLTTRSRSVSQAPSRASSTMPGSSAVSVEQPPPSPSAMSETSHAPQLEAAVTSLGAPSRSETFSPPNAMSVDDEAGAEASAAASDALSSDGGGEGTAPHQRPGTSHTSGKMRALTVRGSEFDIPGTSRLDLSAFSPPPRGVVRRSTSIHLVPRLRGACSTSTVFSLSMLIRPIAEPWNALPSLGARTPEGHYSVVLPPHNEDWVVRWEELTNSGGSETSAPWNADCHLNSEVEPPSRPQRPPSRIFTVSDEVHRIVHATRELFDEISLIKERMQTGARLHKNQSREVFGRRPSNPQQPVPPRRRQQRPHSPRGHFIHLCGS